jgi:ABC-type microcin C transport system duplicated ATPase subunit YejF
MGALPNRLQSARHMSYLLRAHDLPQVRNLAPRSRS